MKLHFTLVLLMATFDMQPLGAQETPAPTPTTSAPILSVSPSASKIPVNLYKQDYDDEKDVFLVSGTQQLYNGPVFSTYDSGAKESEGMLKNGKEEGLWTEYYENGIKASEGNYRGGVQVGGWKFWHENGKLQGEGAYSEGLPIGRWKTYLEDGTLESEGVFIQGKMEGDWKIFDPELGKERIMKYEHGEPLGR